MIVVSGTLTIDPAQADTAQELTSALVAETRKEAGNISYEYFRSHDDAGRWYVFEEWESEDAMNAHMGSPHMAEFMGAAGTLGISGADIQRYDVSSKSKLM